MNFKQVLLPIGVLAIIASMLVPLPTMLLDIMLVSNLILALFLLITSLYISEPLKLSSLPTILLLSTLFRLALNISTTRLILSAGNAGQTIEAFGSIVIQGNFIVGVVVFLVITLVQFIVIAKGSERVAEVSARFTLDALPGKQMSIDADVRAGLIDFETAKRKRDDLQMESRFYGALDGAMKFIKGDAIAGIVICIVNLLGGLMVGLAVEGLDLTTAVSKYSLLTVGDGLVSQIPALMSALAAGLVVTRVVKESSLPIAQEVIMQLGQITLAKILVGSLCLSMIFVPGIPKIPFAVLGIGLMVFAKISRQTDVNLSNSKQEVVFQPRTPSLLSIAISREIARRISSLGDLNQRFDKFRKNIFDKFGLILLRPDLALLELENLEYHIYLRGQLIHKKNYSSEAGISSENIIIEIIDELQTVVSENVIECVDDILTRRILDCFDKEAPELVSAVVPTIATVTQISFVFKNLLAEKIDIKNVDLILQAIAEAVSKGGGERALLAEVRIALKRAICNQFVDDKNYIQAYSLAPIVDIAFAKAESTGKVVDSGILELLLSSLENSNLKDKVLVCSRHTRMLLKETLVSRGKKINLLAYEEIANHINTIWCGVIAETNDFEQEKILERLAA